LINDDGDDHDNHDNGIPESEENPQTHDRANDRNIALPFDEKSSQPPLPISNPLEQGPYFNRGRLSSVEKIK
jgi:hypothetical protein